MSAVARISDGVQTFGSDNRYRLVMGGVCDMLRLVGIRVVTGNYQLLSECFVSFQLVIIGHPDQI